MWTVRVGSVLVWLVRCINVRYHIEFCLIQLTSYHIIFSHSLNARSYAILRAEICGGQCRNELLAWSYFLDRMDGLQGLIIIEDPNDPEEQALKELYDEERVIWLQDWWHKSGASLRTSLDSDVFVGPPQSILIDGKGRFGTLCREPRASPM